MTADITADIVVVGAGPAGAATALLLAPSHRTLLLDRADPSAATSGARRIGEALPAAAGRLFRDMSLWEEFQAEGHAPCYGADSLWGGVDPVSVDSLRDPDGPGWHLDRARFDAWLRRCAARRGAALVAPAKLVGLEPTDKGWWLRLIRYGRPLTVSTSFVIDAGGRTAPVARALGHRREKRDRLVCRWLHGVGAGSTRRTMVAAEAEGWWYTALLPAGQHILAFHTDADCPAARETARASDLLARAWRQPGLIDLLGATSFALERPTGYCAAHSSRTTVAAGPGWLAVGDAALACDPLSSQGLLNALYTAMMATDAVHRCLAGEFDAVSEYQRVLDRVEDAYRINLSAWYALENRWSEQPFWARRHALSQKTG